MHLKSLIRLAVMAAIGAQLREMLSHRTAPLAAARRMALRGW